MFWTPLGHFPLQIVYASKTSLHHTISRLSNALSLHAINRRAWTALILPPLHRAVNDVILPQDHVERVNADLKSCAMALHEALAAHENANKLIQFISQTREHRLEAHDSIKANLQDYYRSMNEPDRQLEYLLTDLGQILTDHYSVRFILVCVSLSRHDEFVPHFLRPECSALFRLESKGSIRARRVRDRGFDGPGVYAQLSVIETRLAGDWCGMSSCMWICILTLAWTCESKRQNTGSLRQRASRFCFCTNKCHFGTT